MSRINQRYKLPRNWIAVPLIFYTIIFFLAIGLISVAFSVFSEYSSTLKARSEIEKTSHYAELYETAGKGSEDKMLNYFKTLNLECIVLDKDRNIIRTNTDVTAVLEQPANDDEKHFSFISMSFVTDEEDGYGSDYFYFPDKEGKLLVIDYDVIKPDILEILLHGPLDFYKNLENRETNYLPYWTAFNLKNDEQIIAFKSYHDISFNDVAYLSVFFLSAYFLAILIFILLVMNIIRTHKNNRNMRKIVFRDNITGNRNWFWFALTGKNLLKKRKGNTQYAIISLAFVGYRNYVLCHSFDEGEQTLKNIWTVIDGFLERNEICAHSTSSNFPILMKVTDEASAKTRLERIIKTLETIGGEHDFKFQAGVYLIDPKIKKNADIDLLYNNASTARMTLEGSDDTGIAFFDQKLVEETKWIDKVSERQREAVEKEEFKVYYQPKYDPRTNELKGAEALIRWVSADLGFVSPGRFIPIFEKSGFITEIDHYMLSHVARDQKKWLDEGRICVPVSVNVSRAHFAETNLAEQIRDIVDKEGAPHDLIEVELTESAFFDDKKVMLTTIKKLKEYGFLVSMDDFGSGYSSLNSLKDMPLDILKLDAGFFSGDKADGRAEIVVSEALQLARKLNMTTVAEGVEEQAQVDFLAAEGCSMIQGYYYAKPMPKEEYELRITPGYTVKPDHENTEAPVEGAVEPAQGAEPGSHVGND